jgi:hypothetical protein
MNVKSNGFKYQTSNNKPAQQKVNSLSLSPPFLKTTFSNHHRQLTPVFGVVKRTDFLWRMRLNK